MTRLPLRDYQVTGIKAMMAAKRFLLCDEPGVAKTRQMMEAAQRLAEDGKPILVVVGLKVALGSWEEQIETWSDNRSVVYDGSPKERKELGELIKKYQPEYVLINIAMFKELYPKMKWSAVIFDEYHKMGLCNRKSKTYDIVHSMINNPKSRAPVVIMATGTPILKSPADLWGPLHLLYPRQFTSYWRFVNDTCTVHEDFQGFKHIMRQPKNPQLLQAQLKGIFIRRRLLQVAPEIKEPIRTYVPITMVEPLRSQYETLAKELMLELGDAFILTPNKISNLIRLRQLLVSPQIFDPNQDVGQMIPTIIEMASEEWEQDKPVIIFTPFRKGVEIIEKEVYKYFNKRKEAVEVFTVMGGDTNGSNSVAKDFQDSRSKKKVLIGTIKSAVSFTATCSDIIYFAGGEHSAVDMDQAERRILRISQSGIARFVYLYHRATYEVKVFKTVRDKSYWADVTLSPQDFFQEDI